MTVKKNHISTFIAVFIIFAIFIYIWEQKELNKELQAIQNNAKVLANPLWNLNYSAPVPYLELAVKHQNLERISILTRSNEVFLEQSGMKSGLPARVMQSIGLIPKIKLESDIIFNDEVIGKVVAIQIHDTIYLYTNIFFLAILLILVIQLYLQLAASKKDLEQRVEQRTTDLRSTRNDLAEEKELLLVTLRSIGEGVITTDTKGFVVLLNKAAEKLTGWKQSDAVGKPLTEVFQIITGNGNASDASPADILLTDVHNFQHIKQATLIAINYGKISVSYSSAPIKNQISETIGAVLVFRDVTEELKRDQEQANYEKLKSVGILAGGIAHDFNNILGAIIGNLEMAFYYLEQDHQAYPLLQQVEKASKRAIGLTQQLLTFAKGGDPIKKLSIIRDIIEETASFILLGSNVRCNYQWIEDLWPVNIDQGQIGQVIQNIVINARQALPEGGTIHISGKNIRPDESGSCGLKPMGYVKISIADTGKGMEKALLDKIFDPYFTTKQTGSGLGLAVCHSIIKKHDGYLKVKSTIGKGTTFSIYLPAAKSQRPETLQRQAMTTKTRCHGRVMIMDDEEMVRSTVAAMLHCFGCETVQASHGDEAISLYKESLGNKPIDLIIMDLTIPGAMGGKEAVASIIDMDPKAKVVVASGYSNDPIMANYLDYGFVAALTKPLHLRDLEEVIHRFLNQKLISP